MYAESPELLYYSMYMPPTFPLCAWAYVDRLAVRFSSYGAELWTNVHWAKSERIKFEFPISKQPVPAVGGHHTGTSGRREAADDELWKILQRFFFFSVRTTPIYQTAEVEGDRSFPAKFSRENVERFSGSSMHIITGNPIFYGVEPHITEIPPRLFWNVNRSHTNHLQICLLRWIF